MTARTWMPLYVADYLADTSHLSTIEHGAYALLIMHYWQNCGLPTEDDKLARVCRLPLRQWLSIKPTIGGFFSTDWRHKRIDEEIVAADARLNKLSAAGRTGGLASAAARKTTAAPGDEAELFRRGSEVLGRDSDGLIKSVLQANGNSIALARAAIERASTKRDPRSYVAAIIRGKTTPSEQTADPRL